MGEYVGFFKSNGRNLLFKLEIDIWMFILLLFFLFYVCYKYFFVFNNLINLVWGKERKYM